MKIAVVTEDGKTISQHFGRAPLYEVFTIEGGRVVARETREKMGHHGREGHYEGHEGHHGPGGHAHSHHGGMVSNILDCSAVIAGGMGSGMYATLELHNIGAILTDKTGIDEAVDAFVDGSLKHIPERLH